MKNYNKIKWKYLLYILVFVLLLIGIRFYLDTTHHKQMLHDKIAEFRKDLFMVFENSKMTLDTKYMMLNEHLLHDDQIANYYRRGDRIGLYQYLKNDFESMKRIDPYLFVMHFLDTKNITFMRMHKPQMHSDDLTKLRPIVRYVNDSQTQSFGFEVGKNGIVYRITSPYIYKQNHLGALEFGVRLNYFTDILNKHFDTFSEILIKKELLKPLTKHKNFTNLEGYSIIKEDPLLNLILPQINLNENMQIIKIASKSYMVSNDIFLKDYMGESVARFIIAKDITTSINEYEKQLLYINAMTIAILLIGMTVLYVIFTKYSNEITNQKETIFYLHQKSEDLYNKANVDTLTSCYNKRYFNNYLSEYLKSKENPQAILIFLDIDHFKQINDTYGHLRGDEVLIWLCDNVKTFLRSDDILARWGGEEFVVLIEGMILPTALSKAEKIRAYIESNIFMDGLKLTISMGVTQISKSDSLESLVQRADATLYKAKQNGRNRVEHS
jgi:diguanylate cyclase (GGDEF)-like protein